MKALLSACFVCFAIFAFGQSIEELEQKLQEAETSKEKMLYSFELAQAYVRTNTAKALEYGKQAHNLATQQSNPGMSAQSAYLVAEAYERARDDKNVEVWLKSAYNFAKQAKDSDLIIKSVDKRSRLAKKQRNEQRAIQIYEEAFTYFSQKGTSISDLESNFDLQKAGIDRQKRDLEKERDKLEFEVRNLSAERDQLSSDKSHLEVRQEQLVRETQRKSSELSTKQVELETVAEEKKRIEEEKKMKERLISTLNKEALADSLVLAERELAIQISDAALAEEKTLRSYFFIGAGVLVLLAFLMFLLYSSSRRAKRKIEEKSRIIDLEREKSDELLLNILPAQIAAELKQFSKVKARRYEEVTVMFVDFKNFTSISEQLSPEDLVEELDRCFKGFDFIIHQYRDVEKIKTIGDAYMCASGLSEQKSMPFNIIRAAFEMQQFLEEQKQERMRLGKPFFEARIGLHTGSVVAGVVGVNKFAYDIWGDTVNIASRMEGNCEPGRINISEMTYNLVKYQFECEYRGKIDAKNKGAIDMYYVTRETAGVTAVAS
ncbi:MAG: adenylate/guanylate cyclase domain-containing protein [Saprospiraceae bacterium]|nr:adenylate/guanylate cyclase domain-containing protein [Saprospiraceae bacterium]